MDVVLAFSTYVVRNLKILSNNTTNTIDQIDLKKSLQHFTNKIVEDALKHDFKFSCFLDI